MDRASGCGPGGRTFESCWARQKTSKRPVVSVFALLAVSSFWGPIGTHPATLGGRSRDLGDIVSRNRAESGRTNRRARQRSRAVLPVIGLRHSPTRPSGTRGQASPLVPSKGKVSHSFCSLQETASEAHPLDWRGVGSSAGTCATSANEKARRSADWPVSFHDIWKCLRRRARTRSCGSQ